MPFKVLYVNPSAKQRPHSSQQKDTGPRYNANGIEIIDASRVKVVNRAGRKMDEGFEYRGFSGKELDANMHDVSGIFKKRALTEQERRRNSSKAYAEKVR